MTPESEKTTATTQRSDWPDRAAQLVVDATDAVREKGISPIYRLTRWIVYGILATILLVLVGVFLLIAIVRLLTVYVFADQVWITYSILGLIFTLLGFLLWSKRIVKSREK